MADRNVTYFVVLGFRPQKGRRQGLVADQPIEAQSAKAARRRAQRYADAGGAGLAFSRTGDPGLGNWQDAVILGSFGEVPEEAVEGVSEAA